MEIRVQIERLGREGFAVFNKGMGRLGDLASIDNLDNIAYTVRAILSNINSTSDHDIQIRSNLFADSFIRVTNFMYLGRLAYIWLRPLNKETLRKEDQLVGRLMVIIEAGISGIPDVTNETSRQIAQKVLRMTFSGGAGYKNEVTFRAALTKNLQAELGKRQLTKAREFAGLADLNATNLPIHFRVPSSLEKGYWLGCTVATITGAISLGQDWGLFKLTYLSKVSDRLGLNKVFGAPISLDTITTLFLLVAYGFKYLESDRKMVQEKGFRKERAAWEKISSLAHVVLYGVALGATIAGVGSQASRIINNLTIGVKTFGLVERACKPSSPYY